MKLNAMFPTLTNFEKDGWYAVSQKGSQVKMRHESKKERLFFLITKAKKWVKDWKIKF